MPETNEEIVLTMRPLLERADRMLLAVSTSPAHLRAANALLFVDTQAPALLAEIRRLRAGIAAMRQQHDADCTSHYRGLENTCTCDQEQTPLGVNAAIDALLQEPP